MSEETTTIAYAWGSAKDDNLKLAVQTIKGMHGNPNGVPGGTGGQAASVPGTSVAAAALLGLAVIGVAVSGRRLAKRRATIR